MKTNKSNKKSVTILSLAMILSLPITSHADGQANQNNHLNIQGCCPREITSKS
ncbi:hypothetical protein [Anaerococcus nagyae]|uniref:hypothetical protein n=1 Tax=Anaerococcus nagyae TaxID=1755241 RepID=UPI001AE3CA79|nr:hypothetical protein [Anaerococcus nagyae]MBP2070276.1 hypothetical protein [Anaerococcus nagyae]